MAGAGYHDGWAWDLEPHPFGDADDPRQRADFPGAQRDVGAVSSDEEGARSAQHRGRLHEKAPIPTLEMTKSEGGGLRSSGDVDVGWRARGTARPRSRRRQYSPNRSWMRDSSAVAIL